jgi:hypothetical protein
MICESVPRAGQRSAINQNGAGGSPPRSQVNQSRLTLSWSSRLAALVAVLSALGSGTEDADSEIALIGMKVSRKFGLPLLSRRAVLDYR